MEFGANDNLVTKALFALRCFFRMFGFITEHKSYAYLMVFRTVKAVSLTYFGVVN